MSWKAHLVAIASLALLCALWVLLQRWLARKDPDLPGVDRRCADCTCDRAEGGSGECVHDQADDSQQ